MLKYKFDSHGENTKTTILPKQQSVVVDEIGQRSITKEKTLDIHYKHNQRESKPLSNQACSKSQ